MATNQSKQVRNDLCTNADEADVRVWLHCVKAAGVRKLVFSPDTDVYHIGLTIVGGLQECDVIVQLSKYTDDRARYFYMNNMMSVLTTDPDISEIPPGERPQVLQSIYIATGCGYTSFFIGLGKVTFLVTFYQHAAFITGRNGPPGSMGQMSLHVESDARFSFLRLIGCAYYKQHVSAFHLKTPESLYFSISNATSTYDHHAKWLAIIRTTVRQRVDMESKAMPSMEALLLHWKRCLWVIEMWHQATKQEIDLPSTLHFTMIIISCNTYTKHYMKHSITQPLPTMDGRGRMVHLKSTGKSHRMLPSQSHPSISSSADASAKQGAPQDIAAVKRKTENVDPVAHAKTRYSHKHKHVQTKLTF